MFSTEYPCAADRVLDQQLSLELVFTCRSLGAAVTMQHMQTRHAATAVFRKSYSLPNFLQLQASGATQELDMNAR
jgi:hypothetical protein